MNNEENGFYFYQASTVIANKLGPDAALVHAVVWNKSKTNGYECKLSEPEIGNEIHISYKRVRKALKKLLELGYIEKTKEVNEYGTKSYKFVPEKILHGIRENEKVTLKCNDDRIADNRKTNRRGYNEEADVINNPSRCDKTSQKDGTNGNRENHFPDTDNIGINKCSKEIKKEILKKPEINVDKPPTEGTKTIDWVLNNNPKIIEELQQKIYNLIDIAESADNVQEFINFVDPVAVKFRECQDIGKLEVMAAKCEEWVKNEGLSLEVAIKLKIEKRLNINVNGADWDNFIKFAAERHLMYDENIETFINWFLDQDYDINFFPPHKLIMNYPKAFLPEKQWCKPQPPIEEKKVAPPPKDFGRRTVNY